MTDSDIKNVIKFLDYQQGVKRTNFEVYSFLYLCDSAFWITI